MKNQLTKLEVWLRYYAILLFSFFTIESCSKKAKKTWKEFQNRVPTESELNFWLQHDPSNVVIVTGKISNIFVVDLDSEEALQVFVNHFGSVENIPNVKTSRGYHLYFKLPDFEIRNRVGLFPGIDIRAEGGYVLAPPSIHPDGTVYQWLVTIEECGGIPKAPEKLLSLLQEKEINRDDDQLGEIAATEGTEDVKHSEAHILLNQQLYKLQQATQGNRNKILFTIACECYRIASKANIDLQFVEDSLAELAANIGLEAREIKDTIQSAFNRAEKDSEVSSELATILRNSSIKLNKKLKAALGNLNIDGIEVDKFWINDTGNARLFAYMYKGNILFDHNEQQWYFRKDHLWKIDDEASIMVLAMLSTEARSFLATKIEDQDKRDRHLKAAARDKSRQKLNAMIDLAKTLPDISFDGKTWDSGRNLLPVKNGIIDLKTKSFIDKNETHKFRKFVKISYNGNAIASRWLQFLDEIFEGNRELINWIQEAVGYTISGEMNEQVFFICHGDGSNGKSLFLRMIRRILGKFAYNASSATFDADNRQNTSADVASLQGRRLVAISEISEGMRLNETLIKQITSGDALNARLLYQNPVEFDPECKLWFAVNHKPRIMDQSNGIWRRVIAIPFNAKFEGNTEDQRLEDKLIAEEEGILAWAIEGAYRWYHNKHQKIHLKNSLPLIVQSYTNDYRGESDPLVDFLQERIEIRDGFEIQASLLYKIYVLWADEQNLQGTDKLSSKSFGEHIKHQFKMKRKTEGNYYLGLSVKEQFIHLIQ